MAQTEIVQVGNVKVEVDLSTAKVIESFRVGSRVKVLKKQYGDNYESHPGVIIGFDRFESRPTIVVAYLKASFANAGIEFAYLNKDSKDIEICHMNGAEHRLNKADIVEALDRDIDRKSAEIAELKARKDFFLQTFGVLYQLDKGGTDDGKTGE